MRPRHPVFALAAAAVVLTGCSHLPVSVQGPAPSGKRHTLDCATQQLIHLGYTIEAGDGVVGFVRGEKAIDGSRRHVLNAMVFDDATTGAATLRVTALFRTKTSNRSPWKRGTADADSIMATCAEAAAPTSSAR